VIVACPSTRLRISVCCCASSSPLAMTLMSKLVGSTRCRSAAPADADFASEERDIRKPATVIASATTSSTTVRLVALPRRRASAAAARAGVETVASNIENSLGHGKRNGPPDARACSASPGVLGVIMGKRPDSTSSNRPRAIGFHARRPPSNRANPTRGCTHSLNGQL